MNYIEAGIAAAIPNSLVTAKGDLIAATGSGVPARLAVAADGTTLTADSASAAGVKWANVGSQPVTYTLTYDGSTVKAWGGIGASGLVDSDTDPVTLLGRLMKLMDPANSGNGGCVYLTKQSAGVSGYPWSASLRVPMNTPSGIEFTCERGTRLVPAASATAIPLFVPDRAAIAISTSGFNDDATIYLASLTQPNGQQIPASGNMNVSTSLVAYTGVASDVPGGGPRLTGCSLTYGPAHSAISSSNLASVAYETWRNIRIHGFYIDCSNLTGLTAGSGLIAGTRQNAGYTTFSQRLNVRGLYVYDNIVAGCQSAGAALAMVDVRSQHYATNEATVTVLEDIHVDDNKTLDTDVGPRTVASISGFATADTSPPTTTASITYRRVFVERNKNQCGSDASAPSTAHAIVGLSAYGTGLVKVADNHFLNSGDDIIEIDNPILAIVENNYMEEATTAGIEIVQFGDLPQVGSGRSIIRNNTLVQRTVLAQLDRIAGNSGKNVGTVERVGNVCDWSNLTITTTSSSACGFRCGIFGTAGTAGPTLLNRLISRDNTLRLGSTVTIDVAGQLAAFRIVTDQAGTTEVVGTGDKVTGTINFAGTSTGSSVWTTINLGGNIRFDDYEVVTDVTVSGTVVAGSPQALRLGTDTAGSISQNNLSGRLRSRVVTLTDSGSRGLRVGSTTTLAFPKAFNVWFDHSGLSAGNDTSFVATSNQAGIFIDPTSVWHNVPATTTLTGLSTGTGKALGVGYPCIAVIGAATGTAITAIDVSSRPTGNYANVLTQASGATPAGANLVIGPLKSDALIKVTFTGTQPTITLVPVTQ